MARPRKADAAPAPLPDSRLEFSKWTTNSENGERSMLVKDGQEVVARIVEQPNDDNPDAKRFELQVDGRNPIVASSVEEAQVQAHSLLGFDYNEEMRRAAEQNRAKQEKQNNAR